MDIMARVLVVDDVAENISVVKNILKSKYDVIGATTGEKALELLTHGDSMPDLILLDVLMSGMDGFEVCEKLKADRKTKDIPVIFLTVLDQVEDMVKGFEVGGVDYVTKPFEVNVLLARVNTHIQLKQQQNQLREMLYQKDQILIKQSKLASLGEMFETIMHQWKQPLSAIAMSNASIRVDKELEMLTDDSLFEMLDGIDDSIQYLSETMDLFRDFLVETSKKEYFIPKDIVLKTLKLLDSKIKNRNIKINLVADESEILAFKNHLIQVLINIINNAIHILQNKTEDKVININIKSINEKLHIIICDNGGGVQLEDINKVFEKNFTTKESKSGTGLGLYISKQITHQYLDGNILVKNNNDGACFTIIL